MTKYPGDSFDFVLIPSNMSPGSVLLWGKELVIQYFDFFSQNLNLDSIFEYIVIWKCEWQGKYKLSQGYTNLQTHITSPLPSMWNLQTIP